MFQNIFYDLLQITPDIFAKIVISDPKSKILVQAKKKNILKKKNITRLL